MGIMLRLLICAVCLGLAAQDARAEEYPNGTVRIVTPYPAGGPLDIVARILAQGLHDDLHRTFIVDNRPGASGNVAAKLVASAAPDGLTLLATGDTTFTVNPFLYQIMPFDVKDGLAPISIIGTYILVLATSSSLPVHSLAELLAYAKQHPVNFASGGVGAPGHLGFEYLRYRTGLNGVHIAYRGGPAAGEALLAGEVGAAFVSTSVVIPYAKSGQLNALAVSDSVRYPALPDVPTVAESGVPDFRIRFASLLMAPAHTKPELIALLNDEVHRIFAQDDVRKHLQAIDVTATVSTPAEAGAWLVDESARWAPIIKASGMKAE